MVSWSCTPDTLHDFRGILISIALLLGCASPGWEPLQLDVAPAEPCRSKSCNDLVIVLDVSTSTQDGWSDGRDGSGERSTILASEGV